LRRNCLLKHVIEGKKGEELGVMRRQGRRFKQLLGDHKETRESWKLKEETLYGTVWRTGCGIIYGPVVRQTME
jgi:hypothetical protein